MVGQPSISLIDDIEEDGKVEEFNYNFKSLVSILAESKLRETWQNNIEKQQLKFYPDYSSAHQNIQPIISDITFLQQKVKNTTNKNGVDFEQQ